MKEGEKMIGTMITAWILTWFSLDDLLITGINELSNTDFTIAVYWVIALLVGLIVHIIERTKN